MVQGRFLLLMTITIYGKYLGITFFSRLFLLSINLSFFLTIQLIVVYIVKNGDHNFPEHKVTSSHYLLLTFLQSTEQNTKDIQFTII